MVSPASEASSSSGSPGEAGDPADDPRAVQAGGERDAGGHVGAGGRAVADDDGAGHAEQRGARWHCRAGADAGAAESAYAPSMPLSRTLPVKPSVTTTSAGPPSGTSWPSTRPMYRPPAGSVSVGQRERGGAAQPVALAGLGADRQQADPRVGRCRARRRRTRRRGRRAGPVRAWSRPGRRRRPAARPARRRWAATAASAGSAYARASGRARARRRSRRRRWSRPRADRVGLAGVDQRRRRRARSTSRRMLRSGDVGHADHGGRRRWRRARCAVGDRRARR